MITKFEILKWENEKAMLVRNQDIVLFVRTTEDIYKISFENLIFKKAIIDEGQGIIVEGESIILEVLGEYINTTKKNLYDSLIDLTKAFKKKRVNLLKFRGDLAEAIFILTVGGEKIYDGASADINLNGKMIEVKSYSPQKRTIHISLQQLNENTLKYAIEILLDNNGKTIIDIANSIKFNSTFKEYLLSMYSKTIFEDLKYKLITPKLINNILPKITISDKRIISANFEIQID